MRAVVIGGCGAMGSEATRDLALTSDFDEITIADMNVARARALADELNATTGRHVMHAVAVDGSDEDALVAVMRAQDVVVNTLTYHFGMAVTRAAIRAGARYVDLGGLHNTPHQLALDADAKAAGAMIVLGCGATPGVTNVLARRGADALDTVEAIHIAFASHRSIAASPGLLDTVIDEFNPDASRFYWENGELVAVRPFDGARAVEFESPVGAQEVYFVPHSETRTLPRFIGQLGKGLRRVDVRGAWTPEIMQALQLFLRYRLITEDVTHLNGVPVQAKAFLRAHLLEEEAHGTIQAEGDWAFLLAVEVTGTCAGRTARRIYRTSHPDMSLWGRTATARMTGIPASIGAQLLAHGAVSQVGVLAPEAAFDPTTFIAELARRGIRVEERIEDYGVIGGNAPDGQGHASATSAAEETSFATNM